MSAKLKVAQKFEAKSRSDDDEEEIEEVEDDDKDDKDEADSDEADSDDETDQKDDLPADILDEGKDSGEEEEYEPAAASSDEEEEEKSAGEEEEEEPDDDDILCEIPGEDDEQPADDDEQPAEDAASDLLEGDDGQVFDDARKKKAPPKRKDAKRRIFPFIQKKKRVSQIEARDAPEFYSLEVRRVAKVYLQKTFSLDEKETGIFEKAIFNAAARESAKIDDGLEADSIAFKKIYLEIVRYFIGAYGKMKKSEVLLELRQDKHSSNSIMFTDAKEAEELANFKIKNPTDVEEDPNYPCPRCKGIKVFKQKVNDRGGDEGTSLRVWCHAKSCGFSWKIRG